MALFSNHPRGLAVLFFSEMWERFCYYGMRVLLTLYLVKSLLKGDAEASLIYGAYTGLVYAAPILGGRMADKFLGYRYAVILGGILMAIGEFFILFGTEHSLLVGMGALIIGNGYFKANISTIVGKLYEDGDERRDSGFTIFYIGINVGALLATTVIAFIGETYGFDKGFGLAGIGMLAGIFIFWSGREKYSRAPGVEIPEAGRRKILGPLSTAHLITLGSLFLIPLCYILILNNSVLNYIFLGLFLYVSYSLITAGIKEDREHQTKIWRDRMIALIIFMIINIVFWACFEQAGTSLTLFADRNVDRHIFSWEMPASMTQFFNPAFIIIFGSLFSMMWIRLSKINRNPNTPMKFAYGIFQLGLGFLITYIGYMFSKDNLVPLLTLVFLYMLHTTGELFLSPIGLSMVTKLSPKKMAGTSMGAWFLSFAIANFLGGQIAALTGSGHGGNGHTDKNAFGLSTTVEEAFVMIDKSEAFEDWKALAADVPKDYEIAKNISYEKWLDYRDWVLLRNSLQDSITFEAYLAKRAQTDTLDQAGQWLNAELWNDLRSDYKELVMKDVSDAEQAGVGFKDWLYFRPGIEKLQVSGGVSLHDGLTQQMNLIQETRLNKYIDVFTKIGFVLIAISILIALGSNPLKKLMHGVK